MNHSIRRLLAAATLAFTVGSVAACSSGTAGDAGDAGAAGDAAPTAGTVGTVAAADTVTVITTVPVTTTAVRTHPVTRSTTSTRTVTDTVTSTLRPKPAGTRTLVKTKKQTIRVTERHTVTAQPPEPVGTFGDGTYVVGKDVAPGTYQASDPNPPDGLCYWETRTADGELANNGVNDGLLFIGDGVFSIRVADCGTWSPVG